MVTSLRKAEKVTIKSSVIILGLSIIKALVGFLSGSIVLLTDAIHSFTDLITNFASVIGLRIAQREPDEKFPYGYFKAENISALFISLFILYLAYEFLTQGFNALTELNSPTNPLVTISTALSSIFVSYGLSKYLISNGLRANSQSLIANGREKRVDVITSIVVLLAVILSFLRIPYVEGFVTILISVFIFWEGLSSAKDAVFSLMDISPSKNQEQQVIKIISGIPGVEGFGNLKLRKSGPTIFGEVDLMVRKEVSVKQARALCNKVESKAKQQIKELSDLSVKVYPYVPSERVIALPVKNKSWLSSKFGRAEMFLIISVKDGEIVNKEFINNPFKDEPVKAGLKAANLLINKGIDEVILKNIGEIAENTMEANLVTVQRTRKRKINTALSKFK